MSARRQARAAASPTRLSAVDGVPQALALGRCIEVWAKDPHGEPTDLQRIMQTRLQFLTASIRYFKDNGLETTAQQVAVIQPSSHWSIQDQPDRFDVSELKALRAQAQELAELRTTQV